MARRKVASQARRRSAAGAPERFNVGGLLKGLGRLPMPRGLSPVAERDIPPLLLESDIALPLLQFQLGSDYVRPGHLAAFFQLLGEIHEFFRFSQTRASRF